jgi:fructose-1,6-bisphosphatase I
VDKYVVTIERFILEQERRYPEATGIFSNLLYDLSLAAKMIHRAVNMAGLVEILGEAGKRNVHGEDVMKLDEYANEVIFNAMDHTGHLCVMGSEEVEEPILIPEKFPTGPYVLLYDPLDGSSNIAANISIGTIFSLHRRVTVGQRDGTMEDLLQPGVNQVAAGYVIYGSSTMLVFSAGNGVHGFTLDPSIGEFLLSHPDIKIPVPGKKIYSVNEGYAAKWSPGQRALVKRYQENGFSSRYVGSLVADFHRTLLYGGVFMYPATADAPNGKLRLLYEVSPMAFLCEQAGGAASDGTQSTLGFQPTDLHERVPVYMGTPEYVQWAKECLAEDAVSREA